MDDEKMSGGRFTSSMQPMQPKTKEEAIAQLGVMKLMLDHLGNLDFDSLRANQLSSIHLMTLAHAARDCAAYFAFVDLDEDVK